MASASSISRIVRAHDSTSRRLVQMIQSKDGEVVSIWPPNASRRQTAALSRIRRLLISRGYQVESVRSAEVRSLSGLPQYYLLVSGRASR